MQKYLLLILITFVSCTKENTAAEECMTCEQNFLIVGLTFGECGGDCSHLYKLEDGKLYADTEATWWSPSDDPSFDSSPIDNSLALTEITDLEAEFPEYLTETSETYFGCPDCGDWGAIHVFKMIDGKRKYWTLDNALESNPEEIQAWTKRVQTLIFELLN